MLKAAVRDDDSVVFFLDVMIPFSEKMDLNDYANLALTAAKQLEAEKISCEVVDPMALKPLDKGLILSFVAKTGRLVAVDIASKVCSAASEIAAIVATEGFSSPENPCTNRGH